MKKIILLLSLTCLFACGTSKTVRTSKKIIKGDWVLNTISYSESGTYNVTLLNDVSKECFENSTWQFTPNNNSGTYAINNTNCAVGDRNFIFTIQEVDPATGLYHFLLKPYSKKVTKYDKVGFRLKLAELSDTNMVWQQTLTVEGKPFTISMNFSK